MKRPFSRTILALLLTTSYTSAKAESHQVCSLRSQIAEAIMGLRQDGVPMRELVEKMENENLYDTNTEVMVRLAYDRPAAHSDEYKKKQKTEFGNAFYRNCINE